MNTLHDLSTTVVLALLTLVSLLASALAITRLRRSGPATNLDKLIRWLLAACAVVAGCLFAYRAILVHEYWAPLETHLDGLLLIVTLLATTVLFLDLRSRMPGVTAFALPVLAVLLAWSVCASSFTLETFQINSIWKAVHLASNYLGTLFFVIAAIAGGNYLYAHRRLRSKQPMEARRPMASLETIERMIIRTATLGFALLSLGLVMGVIEATVGPFASGLFWWTKITLALAVWIVFGIVMNVRHTTTFRGARAAWMSITGMVLVLATIGVSLSIPNQGPDLTTPRSTELP